jgi:NAD(P)-dependent dehydrogenase (short-subunit alcohol dehydrogenase family)
VTTRRVRPRRASASSTARLKPPPVGRTGTADDIAQAIVYLLGNGFTTGAVLDVDGGARMATA